MKIQPTVTLDEAKLLWRHSEISERWELVHHEYVGISFLVMKTPVFSRNSEGECAGRIHVLVDPATKHVVTCDGWEVSSATGVVDVDEDLVRRARNIVAPVIMRKLKLLTTFSLVVESYEPKVLKPNWFVTGEQRQGLVDALTGQVAVRQLA